MDLARNVPSSAVLNGEIYVISGNAGWGYYRTKVVEAYNPITDTWSYKASTHHDGGIGNAVSLGGYIYFIGGGYHDRYFNDNERYDPMTNTWTQMAPMPTARNGLGIAVLDGKIYTIGGYSFDGYNHYYKRVEIYDPATDSWSTGVPMSQGHAYTSATVLDGKIYALSHGFEAFDPVVGAWQVLSAPVGYKVQGGAGKNIQALNGRIYGFEYHSTQVYDPVADEWEELDDCVMPTPRSAFTTSVYEDRIYVIGGDLPGGTHHMASNEYFDVSAVGGEPRVEIVSAEFEQDFYEYGEDIDVGFGITNIGWVTAENLAVYVDIIDPTLSRVVSGILAHGLSLEPGETYQSDWINRWTVPFGATNGEYSMDISVWDGDKTILYDSEDGIDIFNIIIYSLNVPYSYQAGTQWCALYSMSMIFGYYGLEIQPWEIASFWDKSKHEGVDWYDNGWGTVDSIVEEYFESVELSLDDMFYTLNDVNIDEEWIRQHIVQGHPMLFTGKPLIAEKAHSIVITGYVKLDSGDYLIVNDPSGVFVSGYWNQDEEMPFVQNIISLQEFKPSKYNFSYYYAISGVPDPIPSAISLYDWGALMLISKWQGSMTTYYTTLDHGLNWVDRKDYSEYYPVVVSFGDAEFHFISAMIMNHEMDCNDYRISIAIDSIEGDDGIPERNYELTVDGHEFGYIHDASPGPVNPIDLSGLQSGLYEMTCQIGFRDEPRSTYQIDDLYFVYDIPPIADAGTDRILIVGEDYPFDGSASSDDGSIVSWVWDFGDGSEKKSGETTTYSYSDAGVYMVTLTVKDNWGVDTFDTITVAVITPSQATDNLIDLVEDMNLDNGIENGLLSKLENAKKSLDAKNANSRKDAPNKLEAFINEVEAQRGKKITEEQADTLVAYVKWIIDNI